MTRIALVCLPAILLGGDFIATASAFIVQPTITPLLLTPSRSSNPDRSLRLSAFRGLFDHGLSISTVPDLGIDQEPVVPDTSTAPANDGLNHETFFKELEKSIPNVSSTCAATTDFGLKLDDDSPQCVDIVQDLSGRPLSAQYFSEKLDIPNVQAYSCPETEAFRGLMSNACRIRLHPGGETAFYKRIIFETLDHAKEKLKTAPYKLYTDAKSYQVVASFLSSKACQAVTEKTGVRIPQCYDVGLEPNDSNPIESKFSFLLEDLSPAEGWYQSWLLEDLDECEVALTTLAKIHAFFWTGSSFWQDEEAGRELEEGVWKSSDYVQMTRNPDHCKKVAKKWTTERFKCEKELSTFDYWDNLGERLESVAEEAGRQAHPFADDAWSKEYLKYRTFTHGDPKQANFLYRRTGSELELGLIDFQWSGFGLAASDIAHFITSAVHADRLLDGGEDYLLRYYFAELQAYLVEYGAFPNAEAALQSFDYDTFMEQYETGVLDLVRFVIPYAWSRYEPVEQNDEVGRTRTMNKNSYNKSVPNIVWLLSRCDEILKSRGV